MKKELIIYREPKSPVSEVFRTLRTNIQFMNMNKKLKTILVTSTLPGEGKSWVASNLAITFAQTDKRVIIIDADMRKGRQYSIFSVASAPGLSNYLANAKENTNIKEVEKYIQATEIPNLCIMAAGNVPPNPSELLITTQMINLLSELEKECDVVIIDGTPCELVTDSVILSRMVDSTIIVTAYKHTKKANLKKTVKSIQNVGGKIAGIVLNKIPMDPKKYEKTYYYGSSLFKTNKKKSDFVSVKQEFFESEKKSKTTRKTRNTKTKKDIQKNNLEEIQKERLNENTNDRTNDILKQVNLYLEKERSSLNNNYKEH